MARLLFGLSAEYFVPNLIVILLVSGVLAATPVCATTEAPSQVSKLLNRRHDLHPQRSFGDPSLKAHSRPRRQRPKGTNPNTLGDHGS
jgi:hypothetical protein